MWPLKQLRIHPLAPPFLFAALILLAGPARAQQPQTQPPADNVELLRRVVESYPIDDNQLFQRGEDLKKRVAALRNLGELRRALQLSEWKFADKLNLKLTEQDLLYRQQIGARFKQTVEYFLNPQHADAAVRMALANMIGEMGTGVRALTPTDFTGFTRTLAPDLQKLLGDRSADVRAAAAKALGKINADPKEYVPVLRQALTGDPDVRVRRAAADGFLIWVKSVDELSRAGIDAAVSARPEEEVDLLQKVIPAVSAGLHDADPSVRRRSLETFQQAAVSVPVQRPLSPDNLRNPEYVQKTVADIPIFTNLWRPMFVQLANQKDALAEAVQDRDPAVRAAGLKAVQELAFLRLRIIRWVNSVPPMQPQQPPPIKGVWRSVAPTIRLAALRQKDQLPPPKVQKAGGYDEPNLTKALEPSVVVIARGVRDPNPRVRLAAVEFLDFMEDAAAPATDVLLGALNDHDRFVRWAAARALGKISSAPVAAVVRGVTPLLGDPDLDVRIQAAATVERYGPEAAPAVPMIARVIAEMSDPEGLLAMLNALRNIGGEGGQQAVPLVARLLQNPVPRVRRTAAETLGSFGEFARPAEPALRRALNDSEPEVRQAVSDALLAVAPQPPQK